MQNVNLANTVTAIQADAGSKSFAKRTLSSSDMFETKLKNAADMTRKSQSFEKAQSNDVGISDDSSKETAKGKLSSKATELNKDSKAVEEELDCSKLEEKVSEAAKKVVDAITRQLNVSEEDLISAMENLGLTAIDLLNPAQLANLVTELKGHSDSISLVMNDDFAAILDVASKASLQLLEETGAAIEALQYAAANEAPEINFVVDETTMDAVTEIDADTVTENGARESLARSEQSSSKVSPSAENTSNDEAIKLVEETKVKSNSSSGQNTSDSAFSSNKDDAFAAPLGGKADGDETFTGSFNPLNTSFEVTFNPANEVVELPTGETVLAKEIVNQLVEQASIFSTSDQVTMEMILNPEGLGKIFMEVSQKGSEVTAKIFTENEAVKEALENQMSSLRAGLNENTLKVTSVEISVATHEFEKNLEDGQRQNDNREGRQTPEQKRPVRIDLNDLDSLMGLMNEEEALAYQIMKENGNTLNFQA